MMNSILMVAALAAVAAEPVEAQVLGSGVVARKRPSEKARVAGKLKPFAVVKVVPPGEGADPAWYQLVSKPRGWVAAADIIQLPVQGVPGFFKRPCGVALWERQEANTPPDRATWVTIGATVQVVSGAPWLKQGIGAVVDKGRLIGFLAASDVGVDPPPSDTVKQCVTADLASGRRDRVLQSLAALLAVRPDEAWAAKLQAVLLLKGVAADKVAPLPRPFGTPPVAGQFAYVQFGSGRVWADASRTGKPLARLGHNHPVIVDAIEGEMAKVRLQRARAIEVDALTGASQPVNGKDLSGFMWVMDLTGTFAPAVDTNGCRGAFARSADPALTLVCSRLVNSAEMAATGGWVGDGRGTNEERLEKVIRTALSLDRFDVLDAALADGRITPMEAKARLLAGCKGTPAEAAFWPARGLWLASLLEFSTLPATRHLCIDNVDTREPCAPEYLGPQDCSGQDGEECERPFKEKFERQQRRFETKTLPRHQRAMTRIGKIVKDSPQYFQFPLSALPDWEGESGKTRNLVVYMLPYSTVAEADCMAHGEWTFDQATVIPVAIPETMRAPSTQIWIRIPSRDGHEFGAVMADSASLVEAWLKDRRPEVPLSGHWEREAPEVRGSDGMGTPLRRMGLPVGGCDVWCDSALSDNFRN